MKRKSLLLTGLNLSSFSTLLVILIIGNQADLCGQSVNRPRSPTSIYLRAPDTIPGTLPEMRNPAYWIARMERPDNVVLNPAEIQRMNNEYFQRMSNPAQLDSNLRKRILRELDSRPGLIAALPDLRSMTPAELSSKTRDFIGKEIRFLHRGRYANILGIEYSAQELKAIEEELTFKEINDQIVIKTGLTVKDSRLRIIPSIRPEYIGLTTISRWDMWNYDIVPVGSIVHILHASKTGGFLFVLTEKGYGWVSSEEIAFCSEDEAHKFVNSGDFIICTGDRVPCYSDSQCAYASGWFRMGDRLPIKNNNPRLVQIPTRQLNGNLLIQEGWFKPGADINRGYLPYSRKNVIIQAFRLLDNLYDWTGAWYGRDHATNLRDIFSCFGFRFPSNGVLLSAYNGNAKIVYPEEGREAQFKAISANEPFLTLQICNSGHSQLYLGNYNGIPIVFDTHGYSYTDSKGNELVIRRCNIGTILFPDYFLKENFTFVRLI